MEPVTVDQIVGQAVNILKENGTDEVTIWIVAVSVIAAQNGWTLDEASENLANLLNSIENDTVVEDADVPEV
jgi:hypothetical protein